MALQYYQPSLSKCQVYARVPRQSYIQSVERPLQLLSSLSNVIHVTHRPSPNLPMCTTQQLNMRLSRFGKVEAVLQLTYNSFLVVLRDETTAQRLINQRPKGHTQGCLRFKRWNVHSNMKSFYHLVKLLENKAGTDPRFETLMHQDDVMARRDWMRNVSRFITARLGAQGCNATSFFCPPQPPLIPKPDQNKHQRSEHARHQNPSSH